MKRLDQALYDLVIETYYMSWYLHNSQPFTHYTHPLGRLLIDLSAMLSSTATPASPISPLRY